MKKIILTISATLFLAINFLSAQKIDQYYVAMPDVLNPVIGKQQRLELLEYFKAEMGDSIENRFGNQTHVLSLDTLNNHILVQNTDVSTFEMMLFENAGDTIIGIIKTVCAPICQSTIEFYNQQWQKRSDMPFTFPKASEWINADKLKEAGRNDKELRNMLSTSFVSLTFNNKTKEIVAKNNSLEFLEKEQREELTPMLNDTNFVYQYKNGSWMKN